MEDEIYCVCCGRKIEDFDAENNVCDKCDNCMCEMCCGTYDLTICDDCEKYGDPCDRCEDKSDCACCEHY